VRVAATGVSYVDAHADTSGMRDVSFSYCTFDLYMEDRK